MSDVLAAERTRLAAAADRQARAQHITAGCDSACQGKRPSGYPCRCSCHRAG